MSVRVREVVSDRTGAVMVEFAIVLPVLLSIMLGIMQFGMFFYQFTALTEAAAAGARQFSIGRLDATPFSDTNVTIKGAVPIGTCTSSGAAGCSNYTITMSTSTNNGTSYTACTSDSACQTALATAYTNSQPIQVTVTYPCTVLMPVAWVSYGSLCPMTVTITGRAQ